MFMAPIYSIHSPLSLSKEFQIEDFVNLDLMLHKVTDRNLDLLVARDELIYRDSKNSGNAKNFRIEVQSFVVY